MNRRSDGECVLCALVGALLAALAVTILIKIMVFAPHAAALPLDDACNLSSEPCAVSLPSGGTLRFSLGPRPVPLLKPLALELHVEGSSARVTEVDFSGVTLPMAFNRVHLNQESAGKFTGVATLPLCSSGRMVWQATALLEDGNRKLYVPFRFETGRQNS